MPSSGDNREIVVGMLSRILWALVLIVTLKDVWILLGAGNRGEGGTFALMALSQNLAGRYSPQNMLLGMTGAAFFHRDAVITPAISVALGADQAKPRVSVRASSTVLARATGSHDDRRRKI